MGFTVDEKLRIFELHRTTLEGLAYRMTGTLSDAQEIVQDTYLRWHESDTPTINNPKAWLITACSRLAINRLDKAYRQRESYIGEWLPEPFPHHEENDDGPYQLLDMADSLSMALLVTLETLTPTERAAFLLHDVFEMSFDEIAQSLQLNSDQCRQLARRARQKVIAMKPRFSAKPVEHEKLLSGFLQAIESLDTAELVKLFSEEIEMYSDGGGVVQALQHVLKGNNAVAGFFVKIFTGLLNQGERIRYVPQYFNGSLGLLIYQNDELATALNFETDGAKIKGIYAVRNPNKLQRAFPETMSLVN